MSLLICTRCKQVPYIEFLPGLLTKIMCCQTIFVRHIDLEEFLEKYYTLKCKDCSQNKDNNINFCSNKILCDDCLGKYNIKNYIKNDLIPIKCLKDNCKNYEYYELKTHRLYCDYCTKNTCVKVKEFKKNLNPSLIEVKYNKPILYFDGLINRIIKSYEILKKHPAAINSYLNLSNLKKFIEGYSIISPLCQKCKEMYNINILDNNSLEILCNCGKESFNSLSELEKKIDLIECNSCGNKFNQSKMFSDFLSKDIFCEKCAIEKGLFDYLRYNEILYVCAIHKIKNCFFCENYGNYFCEKCNIEGHNIVKIKRCEDIEDKKYSIFKNSNWFMNLIKQGYLNLKFERNICFKKNNINEKFEKFKVEISKKENKDFKDLLKESTKDIKSNINDIKYIDMKASIYSSIYNSIIELEEKIYNLQDKLNEMSTSIELLFKEFCDKNEISQLLKTRNILQHLFTNMIKKNYNCFEIIKGDFCILYESYKYLSYEKKNSDEIKQKLDSIHEKIDNLIKGLIKENTKKSFISNLLTILKSENYKYNRGKIKEQFYSSDNEKNNFDSIIDSILPKIDFYKKIEIFNKVFKSPITDFGDNLKFQTINDYNSYLNKQNAFTDNFKKKDIPDVINNIKNNKFPDNYEKSGLYKFAKLTENVYFDKFGYVHEETLDKNLIKKLLENSQNDDNRQYLILKEEKSNEFLKNVNCENDAEFYFITVLINKLISRIGKIIHQNDFIFQFLFYDINNNLDINNYRLIEEKEKKEIKFSIDKKTRIDSLKNLDFKKINISFIFNFLKEFSKKNFDKMCDFIGKDKLNEIKTNIKNGFKEYNKIKDLKKEVSFLENKIQEFTLFLEQFKDLFQVFPEIKANIIEISENNEFPLYEKNKFDYIEEKNFNSFVNLFVNVYALNTYLMKKRKDLLNSFENIIKDYDSLTDKYFQLEISKKIYDLLLKGINEKNNVEDYFEEEKKKTLDIFSNFFEKSDSISFNSKKLNKEQKEIFLKEQENEKKKFEDMIKKMKNLNLKDISNKFEKYSDYDIYSFAETKFDVVLFLCQNKYI